MTYPSPIRGSSSPPPLPAASDVNAAPPEPAATQQTYWPPGDGAAMPSPRASTAAGVRSLAQIDDPFNVPPSKRRRFLPQALLTPQPDSKKANEQLADENFHGVHLFFNYLLEDNANNHLNNDQDVSIFFDQFFAQQKQPELPGDDFFRDLETDLYKLGHTPLRTEPREIPPGRDVVHTDPHAHDEIEPVYPTPEYTAPNIYSHTEPTAPSQNTGSHTPSDWRSLIRKPTEDEVFDFARKITTSEKKNKGQHRRVTQLIDNIKENHIERTIESQSMRGANPHEVPPLKFDLFSAIDACIRKMASGPNNLSYELLSGELMPEGLTYAAAILEKKLQHTLSEPINSMLESWDSYKKSAYNKIVQSYIFKALSREPHDGNFFQSKQFISDNTKKSIINYKLLSSLDITLMAKVFPWSCENRLYENNITTRTMAAYRSALFEAMSHCVKHPQALGGLGVSRSLEIAAKTAQPPVYEAWHCACDSVVALRSEIISAASQSEDSSLKKTHRHLSAAFIHIRKEPIREWLKSWS